MPLTKGHENKLVEMQINSNTGAAREVVSNGIIPSGIQVAGQIPLSSGTYTRGPGVYNPNGFLLRGHPDNTSYVSFGSSGTGGYPLGANDQVVLMVENLSQVYLWSKVSGGILCWSLL